MSVLSFLKNLMSLSVSFDGFTFRIYYIFIIIVVLFLFKIFFSNKGGT